MGRSAERAGKSVGLAFGTTALVGGIAKSITLAKDFDLTMRQVGVQTDSSGVKLKGLSSLATKMGADTVYSSNDAAKAMLELAKGGLTAAQIKAGALKTSMTLAAAGGVGLAEAATDVTRGMNTFGLSGKQAGQVAVALAGGANASSASVSTLGQALSQVGPGAKNAGMTIQETVAALSAFDQAGIQGSDAGTSLKTMLQRLVPQTTKAKDEMKSLGISFVKPNGQFKSMAQVAQILHNKIGPLSEAQRAQALQTLFGSDATRAATVLMDNGAKGYGKYARAVNDTAKVQKMAKTTQEGASGAWSQFTGSLETAGKTIGDQFLPAFTAAAKKGTDFVNEASTWGPQISETFGPVVHDVEGVARALLPLGHIALEVGKGVGSLPGPVKSFAVEAGVAALVLPRLSAGVKGVTSSLSGTGTGLSGFARGLASSETRMSTLRMSMSALAPMARQAAGAGGLMLLANSAQETHKSTQILSSSLGGIALGASVGGPWGAAIGGLGGLFLGLSEDTHKATSEASRYHDTLNDLTGAMTAQTRAKALNYLQKNRETSGSEFARQMGIPDRQLVNVMMGNVRAYQAVKKELYAAQPGNHDNANLLLKTLRDESKALGMDEAETRRNIAAKRVYSDAVNKLPKDVQIQIKKYGFEPTTAAVVKLKASFKDLDRKDIRILIRENGGVPTKAKVDAIIRSADRINKQHTVLKVDTVAAGKNVLSWVGSITSGTNKGKAAAQQGAKGVADALRTGTGKARANMAPFVGSVRAGANSARGVAAAGGAGVGQSLKGGIIGGFQGTEAVLAAQAAAAVRGAIAAAKAAGDSHSPSRKMHKVGVDLGEGARLGLKSTHVGIGQAGADLVASLVKGVRSKKVSLSNALDALKDDLSKKVDTYNEAVGKRDDLAAGISGMGSSIFAGASDDTKAMNFNSVLAQAQLNLNSGRQTQNDVASVIGKGLSADLIKQLSASGSSGAATLHVLAGASGGQIGQLNSLDALTTQAYTAAGAQAGNTVYGGGVAQATQNRDLLQGILNELQMAKADQYFIQLDGKTIEVAVKKRARTQGHKGRG